MEELLLYNNTSEYKLLRSFILKKDDASFTSLINSHIRGIRKILYALFNGNREDIEDAEQEVILSIYKSLPKFKFKSAFKTYCYKITRNTAINMLRKKSRQKKIKAAVSEVQIEQNNFETEQIKKDIFSLLLKLDKKEKELIILKDVEKLSLKEISEILKIPEGTVKSRLHRARDKLISILNKYEKGEKL